MERMIKIKDAFIFLKKSKIKAGDGLEVGKYPFYTSSSVLSKYLDSYEIEEESLIFGTGGSASVHHSHGEFSSSTDCFVVQSNNKYEINLRYVYLFLSGNIHILENGFKGAGLKHISKKYLDDVEILLPSLGTQKEIVGVLDKAQGLIDTRKEQIRLMDELIQSVFYEMFGDGKFSKVRAQDVCEFITKGTTPKAGNIIDEYSDGLVPFIKVYNLSFDGTMLFDEKQQFITSAIHSGELSRSVVYPNDVLMNIVGPPLGKFSIVPLKYKEWNINQAIAIFRATKEVIPQYLLYALMQPKVIRPFINSAVGIRQQNLNLVQCRNLEIPLPPLSMQKEFSKKVQKIKNTRISLKRSLSELENNFNGLMQNAFSGSLFNNLFVEND